MLGLEVRPEVLLRARNMQRMSRTQLAVATGVSFSMLTCVENGEKNPGPKTLDRLGAYFGAGFLEEFLTEESRKMYAYSPPVQVRPRPVVARKKLKNSPTGA